MRIAFLGAGAFGIPTLESLVREHEVVCIVTQPDKPAGRGMSLTPTPIAQWASEHAPNIPVFKPVSVSEAEACANIRAVAGPGLTDAWIVIAFGQKLPPEFIEGVWAVNLHGSLLPRWRGAGPVQAAILAGDAVTGNTVITIAQRMDAGLMLGSSQRTIESSTTAGDLHDLLSADGPALIREVLQRHATGNDTALTQDESLVTKARKLSKLDAWVDFAQSAEECRRRINGLNPWPGVTVRFRDQNLRLLRSTTSLDDVSTQAMHAAQSHAKSPRPAGQILAGATGLIACGQGTTLRLLEVQAPGKRAMKWSEFANGAKIAGTPSDAPEMQLQGGKPQ
jgi:methionyl-tRNA formyltransferase